MRKSSFLKHINELTEEELRKELDSLFTNIPEVRNYYKMDLGTDLDRKKLFDKAKKDILSKYASKSYRRPRRPRIQKINTILADMSKLSIFDYEMLDLYLYNTECAVDFMINYRFGSPPLFNTIVKSFTKSLLMIQDGKLQNEFKDRCQVVIDKLAIVSEVFDQVIPEFVNTFEN